MSELTVRDAAPGDERWVRQTLASHKDLAGSFYWSWQGYLKHPKRHRWLIALDGEVPVGTIHFYHSVRKKSWVVAEIIATKKRAGIGRFLMTCVPEPTRLTTNDDNPESHQFYQALGFVKTGTSTTRRGAPLTVYTKGAPCAA